MAQIKIINFTLSFLTGGTISKDAQGIVISSPAPEFNFMVAVSSDNERMTAVWFA